MPLKKEQRAQVVNDNEVVPIKTILTPEHSDVVLDAEEVIQIKKILAKELKNIVADEELPPPPIKKRRIVNDEVKEIVLEKETIDVSTVTPNSGKLADYPVYIQDMDVNSKFFKISKMPQIFASGKNGFLIRGTSLLRVNSRVLVDVMDANGNSVEIKIPDVLISGVDRLIVVNVKSNNYYGDAIVTILGEAIDVPNKWKGVYNVKWQKRVLLNPTVDNEDDVIFVKNPSIAFSEIYDTTGVVSKVNYTKTIFNQGLMYSKIAGEKLSPLMSYYVYIDVGETTTTNENFTGLTGWDTSSAYITYVTASNNKLILSQSYGLFGVTEGVKQYFSIEANKVYTLYATFNGSESFLGGSVASIMVSTGSNLLLYLYTTASTDVTMSGEFSSSTNLSASVELSGQAFALNTVWSNVYVRNLVDTSSAGFGFTKEMEGGKLYISSSAMTIYPNTNSYITASYEAYIYKVINNTTAIMNNSFQAYNTVLANYERVQFTSASYVIEYNKKEYIGNENIKNSYLKIQFKNLDTHVGSLKYIDLYKNPGNTYIGRYPIKAHDMLVSGSEFSSSVDFTNNWTYIESGTYSLPHKSYEKKSSLIAD